jgi:hypothetical protein
MTDTPSTDPNQSREAAGLIATALLDGKPAPWTSWVAVEAIEAVGKMGRVVVLRGGAAIQLAAFSIISAGEIVTCLDEKIMPESHDSNKARTEARREAILDLWAAARLKAKEMKP